VILVSVQMPFERKGNERFDEPPNLEEFALPEDPGNVVAEPAIMSMSSGRNCGRQAQTTAMLSSTQVQICG
jgi:hypothetical protein